MIDDPLAVYEPPDHWTPDHVLWRFTQAYETLARIRQPVGPSGAKAAWPGYHNDWNDELDRISLMGDETVEERDSRLSTATWDDWERNSPPDAHEVTLMDECFLWPGKYLVGIAEDRIAITRWAEKRAKGSAGGDVGIALVTAEAAIISRGLARAGKPLR